MFFEIGVKKRIREVGKSAFLPFTPEKTEKFAEEADFFGYPSYILPACGKDVYVCLPPYAHVFDGNKYVYENDALPAQFFPQGKVYRVDRPLIVVGERKEERFFKIDPQKEDLYYALLALYALTKNEKNKVDFSRRKKILKKGTAEEIYKETGAGEKRAQTPYRVFPPLAGFPESLISYMLEDASETVCFPQGGLWRGLIPILSRSGVTRVILPARGEKKEPFCWTTDDCSVNVYYQDLFSSEEKRIRSFFRSEREEEFEKVTKNGEDESFYNVVWLSKKEREISGEGESLSASVVSNGITNGVLSVEKRADGFFVKEKDITLSLLYRDEDGKVRHCGKVSERKYLSGRFVLFEEHCYYRESTARVRIMLEEDKEALRVDFEGVEEGFELAVKVNGSKEAVFRFPFSERAYEKDGSFFAKDRVEIRRDKKTVIIRTQPMLCKKEGETFYFPLRSFFGKRSLIID